MRYIINPGHSFVDSDGSIKTGGDAIALSDEMAAAHRDKVTVCAADLGEASEAAEAPLQRIDYFASE